MVPMLSALSLALCHEVLEGGGYQQMGTIKYAKRNFPSCSLRSQFTASQKRRFCSPIRKHRNHKIGTVIARRRLAALDIKTS